jgi:hypothetical protein
VAWTVRGKREGVGRIVERECEWACPGIFAVVEEDGLKVELEDEGMMEAIE